MSTDIFYFSGTGNSLFAARQLKTALSDRVRIQAVKSFSEQRRPEVSSDCIIIVFPVYFQTVPRIVRAFIKKLNFKASSTLIYGVATCNGGPGHSLYTLDRLLKMKGNSLMAGFTITLPGNSLIIKDFTNPPEVRARRLEESYHKLNEISNCINNKDSGRIEGSNSFKSYLQGLITGAVAKYLYKTPTKLRTAENCSKCGICTGICPVNNIKMGSDGIEWGNNCEHCLACFHWCPRMAIEIGNSTIGKLRYHHPEISISDMYCENRDNDTCL